MEVTARIFVFKEGFKRVMKSPAVGKKSYRGGLFVIFCLGRLNEKKNSSYLVKTSLIINISV